MRWLKRLGTRRRRTSMRSRSDSPWLRLESLWTDINFAFRQLRKSQRTREIGVRMALGAERSSVYQLILKEAGWLTLIGLALGLSGSIAAGMFMQSLLFSVRFWDVSILGAVAAVLVAPALLASYIPARRAASVDPVEALRAE